MKVLSTYMIEVIGIQISFLNVLTWIAFGLVVGLIASAFSTERLKGGMYAAVLLGVIGAITGGAIATVIMGFGMRGFDITAFVVAITGSIVFLVLHRILLHDDRHFKTHTTS